MACKGKSKIKGKARAKAARSNLQKWRLNNNVRYKLYNYLRRNVYE